MRGGNANNTTNAGFVYLNTNNAASITNANIGAQLSIKLLKSTNHASWQKITFLKTMLVINNERFV